MDISDIFMRTPMQRKYTIAWRIGVRVGKATFPTRLRTGTCTEETNL